MDETYVVYADVLFLINFILDFLCLYVAGAILSVRIKIYRFILAALFGGAYSLAAVYLTFLPPYVTLPAHIAAALILCLISYGFHSVKTYSARCAVFAVSAAFSGGMISAAFALTGRYYTYNGGLYAEISPVFLITLAFVSVGAAYLYALVCRKKTVHSTLQAVIEKDGHTYRLTLLVDSGCFVVDPITGKRVIIVSYAAFKGVIPHTPRYIPIKTAGGGGMLCGFKPDKLTLNSLGKRSLEIDAIVAVDMNTEGFSGYDGLVPPSLI
ncbi:MAG: sigma-E processing peptidase SpoIIGA [Victivallales bacterium]|nr:sigma-E processing peptidase SpoIIGA [Eubacteriales bacterium]